MRAVYAGIALAGLSGSAAGADAVLLASAVREREFRGPGEQDTFTLRFAAEQRTPGRYAMVLRAADLDESSDGLVLTATRGDRNFDLFVSIVSNGEADTVWLESVMDGGGSAWGQREPEAYDYLYGGDPDRVDLLGWDVFMVRLTLHDIEMWWDGSMTHVGLVAEYEMIGFVPSPGVGVFVVAGLGLGVRRRR